MRVWFDMGGIEDRQGFFAGNGATAVVGFGDQDPESALAEAGAGQVRVAVAFLGKNNGGFMVWFIHRYTLPFDPFADLPPDALANFLFGTEGFSLGDTALRPEIRDVDPVRFGEEEGIGQDDAADLRIDFGSALFRTVFLNGGSES